VTIEGFGGWGSVGGGGEDVDVTVEGYNSRGTRRYNATSNDEGVQLGGRGRRAEKSECKEG